MVMWRTKSCPRCGGDIYMDIDENTLFEHCLQCGYMRPRLSEPCPECGFGMYFESAEGRKYLYCSNCGHSVELQKAVK